MDKCMPNAKKIGWKTTIVWNIGLSIFNSSAKWKPIINSVQSVKNKYHTCNFIFSTFTLHFSLSLPPDNSNIASYRESNRFSGIIMSKISYNKLKEAVCIIGLVRKQEFYMSWWDKTGPCLTPSTCLRIDACLPRQMHVLTPILYVHLNELYLMQTYFLYLPTAFRRFGLKFTFLRYKKNS